MQQTSILTAELAREIGELLHRFDMNNLGPLNNMNSKEIAIAASVIAMLRDDVSASCVADRFGVTEACANSWKDTFIAAGILAVVESHRGRRSQTSVQCDDGGGLGDPTTTPYPGLKSC